jgi:hypothetical protein
MAGVLVVVILALVALVWIVVYVVREETAKRERVDHVLHEERTPTLEYAVPTGQDPVVILAALEREGYTATVDADHDHQIVLIACPAGLDRQRAQVRSIIASADSSSLDDAGGRVDVDVRFLDEV